MQSKGAAKKWLWQKFNNNNSGEFCVDWDETTQIDLNCLLIV